MKRVNSFIFRSPSPVDEFVHEVGIDDFNKECTFVQNDLVVLFNQERLFALGADTANAILESYAPNNDVLSKLKQNLSTEQLLKYIKSRHIQSRSELTAWLDSLSAEEKYMLDAINEANAISSDSPDNTVSNAEPV